MYWLEKRPGPKGVVRYRNVSATWDVRYKEVLLYFILALPAPAKFASYGAPHSRSKQKMSAPRSTDFLCWHSALQTYFTSAFHALGFPPVLAPYFAFEWNGGCIKV